jgi:uncharacterized protein YrrD
VEDLGPPIAHLALEEGTPVYDRSGEQLGVVDRVVTDNDGDIFEGVIIHTHPLPGRHLYANHDQIAELRERGVLLSVHRDALHEVSAPSPRKPTSDHSAESPVHAALRRAWDWLTGLR